MVDVGKKPETINCVVLGKEVGEQLENCVTKMEKIDFLFLATKYIYIYNPWSNLGVIVLI